MHKKVQLSDELSLQLRASLARAAAAWQRVAVSFDHSQGAQNSGRTHSRVLCDRAVLSAKLACPTEIQSAAPVLSCLTAVLPRAAGWAGAA